MPYPFSPGEILTATNLNNALGVATTWSSPVSSGITVGNGTVGATYVTIGDMVFAFYRIVLGGTSAITGALTFNLPVNALTVDGIMVSGQFVDVSAPATILPMLSSASATQVVVGAAQASGTYAQLAAISSTVPFTWASTDEINLAFEYIGV